MTNATLHAKATDKGQSGTTDLRNCATAESSGGDRFLGKLRPNRAQSPASPTFEFRQVQFACTSGENALLLQPIQRSLSSPGRPGEYTAVILRTKLPSAWTDIVPCSCTRPDFKSMTKSMSRFLCTPFHTNIPSRCGSSLPSVSSATAYQM